MTWDTVVKYCLALYRKFLVLLFLHAMNCTIVALKCMNNGHGSHLQIFILRKNGHDEYINRIPNPEHIPKYTKVKVLSTQDKHYISWAALQSYAILLLPYKRPCCYWPPKVCCHILIPDWLPAALRTRQSQRHACPGRRMLRGVGASSCFVQVQKGAPKGGQYERSHGPWNSP